MDDICKDLELLVTQIDNFENIKYRESRVSEQLKSILTRLYAVRSRG